MLAYASRTGTRRNIAALRAAGWRLLVSAAGVHRHEGMPYGLDNGAWSAFKNGQSQLNERVFDTLLESHGARADFIVVPDVVADAQRSMELTTSWLPRLLSRFSPDGPRLLIAVQDGMMPYDVEPLLTQRRIGLFLGGSTEWKLHTMRMWGDVAGRRGLWYHVGRVNSAKRIRAAADSGATSFDGTSVTMYAETLPLLDAARREGTLVHGPAFVDPPRDFLADAQLVESELPNYRDDEEVTLEAGALRLMLARARGVAE